MQHQIIDASALPFRDVQVFHPLEQYNATPFAPHPYDPPHNVERQHHFPRFGHTNNFAALVSGLSGSSDEATNYIVGIFAGAMLILGVAMVWAMVILGLKVAGQKKVGFLAGRLEHPSWKAWGAGRETLTVIEEEPEDAESLLDSEASSPLIISNDIELQSQTEKEEKRFNRKVLAARAVFVLSGLLVIVMSILFYVKGVDAFRKSLSSAHGGIYLAQEVAFKTINMTDNAIKSKDELLGDLRKTKEDMGGQLCEAASNNIFVKKIKKDLQSFESEIEELSSMIDDNIGLFSNDLKQFVAITEDVDEKLNSADIFFYIAIGITVFINVLIAAMLVQAYFSGKGVSNRCTKFTTHAILWPVFIFFLVLEWIFAVLFLVASLAGSDFCVKPDVVVEGFLREHQDQFHSAIFEYLIYYISGCKVLPEQSQVEEIASQINVVLNTVHDLSETLMGVAIPSLERECGLDKAATTALESGAELLHQATHTVNQGWIGLRHLLECKTFNPIYTTFIHDAICIEAVDGLTWLYSSAFVMFISSMVMIMFRAGLYPVRYPASKPSD